MIEQRFAAAATIDGYEVIDVETGRSLGFERPARNQANGIAQQLNLVATGGPQAIARFLRADARSDPSDPLGSSGSSVPSLTSDLQVWP